MQRPKTCACAGSAVRLNAGSHPIGGRGKVNTSDDEVLGVSLRANGNRSPLLVRLTETISDRSLFATPALLEAAVNPPAIRQPNTAIAAAFLGVRRNRVRLVFEMKVARSAPMSGSPCGEESRTVGSLCSIARWLTRANRRVWLPYTMVVHCHERRPRQGRASDHHQKRLYG
jgi:hypothetical protein